MNISTIKYEAGGVVAHGYVAYKEDNADPKPAILIAHDWTGLNENAQKRAQALAEMGYVGFALDMYGDAKQGSDNEDKMKLMSPLLEKRSLLRDRVQAAYQTVKDMDNVDSDKIAIIGYCFGGLCALDLARSGCDIQGAISFHGLLNAPSDLENEKITAKVLVLHGHDDPMVPPEQVLHFQKEMTASKADWQMHIYGNTQHAFTTPQANNPKLGTIYSETADKRSWLAMLNFLQEIF